MRICLPRYVEILIRHKTRDSERDVNYCQTGIEWGHKGQRYFLGLQTIS